MGDNSDSEGTAKGKFPSVQYVAVVAVILVARSSVRFGEYFEFSKSLNLIACRREDLMTLDQKLKINDAPWRSPKTSVYLPVLFTARTSITQHVNMHNYRVGC
jgi:hypothetical protein